MENTFEKQAVVLNNEVTFEEYIEALIQQSAYHNDLVRAASQEYEDILLLENYDLSYLVELRSKLSSMHSHIEDALHFVEKAESLRTVAEFITNEKFLVEKRKEEKNNGK